MGVEVDVDAPVEVLVGKDAGVDADAAVDVDVDVAVVRDASLEKYANVKLDVHAGVDVDVGLGVSVESGVEVSMHFFFCSYTVGPLKGGNAQDKWRNMFRVNLWQGHPISYNFTTFFSKNLIDEWLNVFLKERINARGVIALRIYQETNKNKNKTKNKMGKQVHGEGQTSISTIWSYFPFTYACHLFFILLAQK